MMAGLWGSNSSQNAPAPPANDVDIADTGIADVGLPSPNPQAQADPNVGRPQLQRNQPAPPPPHQPPPPPAPQQVGNPTDSLSLMQLRRIVSEFPRVEPTAYAFTYADTASFEEEIDEWFSYHNAEFLRLRRARETFERRWKKNTELSWMEASKEEKRSFIKKVLEDIPSDQLQKRCKSLQTLLHIVLGVWQESAGPSATAPTSDGSEQAHVRSKATKSQVQSMKDGVDLITECDGVNRLYEAMRHTMKRLWDEDYRERRVTPEALPYIQDELDNVTTVLYILIETARNYSKELPRTHEELVSLHPSLVEFMATATARLRWDDSNDLPQTRMFLLFWKSLLLVFGGTSDLDEVKTATAENLPADADSSDLITASPLDYHLFRQEITSKYPAYIPPAPLLPLELDHNSILPPLPNHPTRNTGANGILPTPANANSGGSILHQPVHIATPAPSPPPSPPVGGKAGKKQNYQTNQNFPFMYPPLDSTSNSAGGKGAAGLQEALVGRKWEGSEIPASILEAGELFAKRTRMTRAIRQLWDERENFLKFDRGWDGRAIEEDVDFDVDELDLDKALAERLEHIGEDKTFEPDIDLGPTHIADEKVRLRLEAVEAFYSTALPHLQSLVIVLLKAILANVTALIAQPMNGQQNGLAQAYQSEINLRNGMQGQRRPQDPMNPQQQAPFDILDLPTEELEALRAREITAKAVSGILLSLLKWFKVSHVLKFEYLTQLLLDSNYLPLVLKLFAHQDVDKVVDTDSDRQDLSFFSFCNANSNRIAAPAATDEDSEDDAAPPPIKLSRSPPANDKLPALTFQDPQKPPRRDPPEVDELGYSLTDLPTEPKTDYSWRNFFSSINFLRIMQKICKNKAHRNLLLVQYKSSNILKKALKIPQHELRLYTLKLFKNQVPYCGRKWRQGNMRVITAVYLHCRPELRDDWLAGSDVDADVEEALPLEQALRALTHWHNVKRYHEQMGADMTLLEEEMDFFNRELEKMEISGEEAEAESAAGEAWDFGYQ